ncbi:hypothetical protein MCOR17_000680 [Pyricularia oryzae]|nr:hypothetical protein MCOR17_000680 [Pyricularia oryzae]
MRDSRHIISNGLASQHFEAWPRCPIPLTSPAQDLREAIAKNEQLAANLSESDKSLHEAIKDVVVLSMNLNEISKRLTFNNNGDKEGNKDQVVASQISPDELVNLKKEIHAEVQTLVRAEVSHLKHDHAVEMGTVASQTAHLDASLSSVLCSRGFHSIRLNRIEGKLDEINLLDFPAKIRGLEAELKAVCDELRELKEKELPKDEDGTCPSHTEA